MLLVDDHPREPRTALPAGQSLGYAAESAGNGIEALEKWKSGRFAVITDCHMAEMDGYELARAIRKLEFEQRGSRIPILTCTVNAQSEEAETCRAAGMDDYVSKPLNLAELANKLLRWLPLPCLPGEVFDGAPAQTAGCRAARLPERLIDLRRLVIFHTRCSAT